MTGCELLAALKDKLQAALPDMEVRVTFSGRMTRSPSSAVLCIGLLSEERADGAGSAKLGVWLYTPAQAEAADLFTAVCGALQEIPCTVRSVTRGEAKYDSAVGCVVTPCTVWAVTTAAEENRTAVRINGEDCLADGFSVSLETQSKSYGSIGEETPHTIVTSARTYRVTLTGLSGAAALLELENFAVDVAGVRYAPCVWKKIESNRLVLEAGGAETITESGENV